MNNFDFNLLVVLNALLEDCSVNLAARKLNVTAPAISKSLNKIRVLFNDPILVRSGTKLIPTPKAIALKEDVRQLVNRIESMLNTNMAFEPHTTTVSFTIAANATIVFTLNATLFRELQKSAPNVFINMVHDSEFDDDFLRSNDIDLYIGEMRDLNPEITIRTIHSAKCYFMCRCGHPIICSDKNMDNLLKYQFVQTKEKYPAGTDEAMKYFWSARQVMGATPGYMATMNAITHSDALAIVPDFVVKNLRKLNIAVEFFSADFDLGKRSIIQAWHSKHNHSPCHKWLRDLTKVLFVESIK
ncbi:LysR family transcriptional regulator [Martelella alba]|uniref:LysR family transcriptional regulator n=1 Tax=Martelella alba TaxID=2590451 RepID=A0ABY2SFE8_9HYPH|nr:LysR family transcriptional regulator [Martelella alba]TKI02979.1 LysR family transcriptional regulator [Martelella alba]